MMATMQCSLRRYIGAVLALFVSGLCSADVVLAPFFRDHAVVQRDLPLVISGMAFPGEEIEITFGAATAKAAAAPDGAFSIELPPQAASAEPRDLVVQGKNTVTVKDVLVGDVWLCSGQSNMEWVVGQLPDAADTVASATDPNVRYFKTPHKLSWKPRTAADGAWTIATGEAVRGCTSIGYFFARELRSTQGVPIGILDCSWGGTRIEPWLPFEAIQRDTELMGDYNANRKQVEGTGDPTPDSPTAMWNAMVAPFTTVRIKGIAWYQGESNAGNPTRYRRSLPLLIDGWRKAFGDPKLPFGVFQLASFMPFRVDLPVEEGWAELREAQTLGALSRGAGIVVLLDIGDAADIHPPQKAEAGRRLALWARAKVYGEDIEYSGPMFRSATPKAGAIVVTFDHGKGLSTRDGKAPGGFAIAGADGKFVWATATIVDQTVVVSSPEVPNPTQVRYAWHNNPETANLVNGAGLPASAFRSDPPAVPAPKPTSRPAASSGTRAPAEPAAAPR
jgi:sialate O-acetylesterase